MKRFFCFRLCWQQLLPKKNYLHLLFTWEPLPVMPIKQLLYIPANFECRQHPEKINFDQIILLLYLYIHFFLFKETLFFFVNDTRRI